MTGFASAIYLGSVVHTRLRPVRHRLRYPLPMLLLDLDETAELSRRVPGFSAGRFNFVAFHERDHLAGDGTPLRGQIEALLAEAGIDLEGGAIRVLCMPRVLGAVFNPLSLFYCHGPKKGEADGELRAVLYEVNNTFGQRHCYLIPTAPGADGVQRQTCRKCFYVSPFMEMSMQYHFRLAVPGERVAVSIEARDKDGPVLSACFAGKRQALSGGNLLRLLPRFPLLAFQVLGGIHWEALKLWFKGVRLRPRPPAPAAAVSIVRRSLP